jgi:phosphoribosylamine--glycine ligase/phosphoribosylformylglycinamidine cyclo-ligase
VQINLVIPGPEQPLVDGIEKFFRRSAFALSAARRSSSLHAVGIPVFGPSAAAAALEGSKTYSKDFMRRHNIPTAAYANFDDVAAAKEYVKTCGHRVVIKATGLAAGKGVLLPQTIEEAIDGLDRIMVQREFGDAGKEVVVEEYLEGQELSILAFCDGYTALPLPGAQDHKQIGDGDTGPNTGGMGAYSPAPIATAALNDVIMKTILQPSLAGMRKDGASTAHALGRTPTVRRDALCRLPLCRPHDHRFRAQGPRVQRPLRRSGNADLAPAVERRDRPR